MITSLAATKMLDKGSKQHDSTSQLGRSVIYSTNSSAHASSPSA